MPDMKTTARVIVECAFASSLGIAGQAEARVSHHHRKVHAAGTASGQESPQARADDTPIRRDPPRTGVAGYFGPPPFYGYGPAWGQPRGDLGFALLGALNGGGFRGFVECGNYYARYPGACGF